MEEPRTHPRRPDQGRHQTSHDVLAVAEQLRDMLSNEEIWYVLQTWKEQVIENAKKEAYEKDDPCNCDEPRLHPWGDIGGEAWSEREAFEL